MLSNKDIIPLYVNDSLMNNLFTVVVQEFKESMKVTTRSQQVIKIDTPLANVMKGRYVQGRFNLELLNEYSRQRTEESISIIIWVLLQTKGILQDNNLLKSIATESDVANIKQNDYIEFRCKLNKNPQVKEIEDLIKCLKMKQIFDCDSKDDPTNIIALLSKYLETLKQSNCIKCYTDGICGTDLKAIIPVQMKYMQDNLDFLSEMDIVIMGKVLKVEGKEENKINLCGGTCYDYLTEKYIEDFKKKYLEDTVLINRSVDKKIINESCPLIEVIPLAMYI